MVRASLKSSLEPPSTQYAKRVNGAPAKPIIAWLPLSVAFRCLTALGTNVEPLDETRGVPRGEISLGAQQAADNRAVALTERDVEAERLGNDEDV